MLKKSVYNMRKRLVAFALAAAMVCTNVGADLNAAYAATSSSGVCTHSEWLVPNLDEAIEEAIENGNVISPGDLGFYQWRHLLNLRSLFSTERDIRSIPYWTAVVWMRN